MKRATKPINAVERGAPQAQASSGGAAEDLTALGRAAAALGAAFQTLTRIPVSSARRAPDASTLGLSAVFYPLVGVLAGALGWAVWELAAPLGRGLAAALTLAAWTLFSGALHEDGLADSADAFGSRRPPERTLEILKDSRVGSYGVAALCLTTLVRWQALASLDSFLVAALFASQVLPRTGIVVLALWAGPAGGGSGGALARGVRARHAWGAGLLAAVVLAPPAAHAVWLTVAAAGACLAVVAAGAIFFRARIGGVTGDCLGAALILQEIAVLLCFAAGSGALR